MNIVYVHITSYAGMAIGAIHSYGKLIYGDKEVELLRKLTKRDATKLNKHHEWTMYRAGMETRGFDTEDDVRKKAILEYKSHFPDADILVEGAPYYHEPKLILDGSKELIAKAEVLYNQANEIGFWNHSRFDGQMQKITDEWYKLVEG